MSFKGERLSVVCVPDLHRLVVAPRGEAFAVGAEATLVTFPVAVRMVAAGPGPTSHTSHRVCQRFPGDDAFAVGAERGRRPHLLSLER